MAIIIALIFARLKASTYHIPFIGIIINIVGTFLHEISHYLVALFFNGQPIGFSLFPKRHATGWILGSVEVSNSRWYNAVPVAMAPLLLFVAAYYLDQWYSLLPLEKNLFSDMGYLIILVVLIENAIPSLQDFKVAFSHKVGLIVYSSVILYLLDRIVIHPIQF